VPKQSENGHIVNCGNGLNTDTAGRCYDFRYSSFETGYSFNAFKKNAAFLGLVSLHLLFSSRLGTNKFFWHPHLSMGP
jgi:hypothetical protein